MALPKQITATIPGEAVTTILRSLYIRKDLEGMRKLCLNNISDDILIDVGMGKREVVGDSDSGLRVVDATPKTYGT